MPKIEEIIEELQRHIICYEEHNFLEEIIEEIIDDLELNGFKSKYIFMTDTDYQQVVIKVGNEVWIYSKEEKTFYDWKQQAFEDIFQAEVF